MTQGEPPWAPPDGSWIDLASGRCFYREAGTGAPCIVLLHGVACDSRIHARIQPLLARRCRSLAPDFLGWGFSQANEGVRFGFETLDRNLNQFIDAHGLDDVVIVCQEMSGPAAIRWVASNPERTRALVMLNTYYGWSSGRMPPVLKLLHLPLTRRIARRFLDIGRGGTSWWLYSWQMGRLWSQRTPESERVLRLFHNYFRHSSDARRAFHAVNGELVEQVDSNQRRLDLLTGLECPTLILWGQRDRYLGPSVARQFHRLVPGSELHMVPGAGHFVQFDAAAEVAEAISNFVDRTARPGTVGGRG